MSEMFSSFGMSDMWNFNLFRAPKGKPKKKRKKKQLSHSEAVLRVEEANSSVQELLATKIKVKHFNFSSAKAFEHHEKYFQDFKKYSLTKELVKKVEIGSGLVAPIIGSSLTKEELAHVLCITFKFLQVNELELLFFLAAAYKIPQHWLELKKFVPLCHGSYLFTKPALLKKREDFKEAVLKAILISLFVKERTSHGTEKLVFLVAIAHLLNREVAKYAEEFLAHNQELMKMFNLIELNEISKLITAKQEEARPKAAQPVQQEAPKKTEPVAAMETEKLVEKEIGNPEDFYFKRPGDDEYDVNYEDEEELLFF